MRSRHCSTLSRSTRPTATERQSSVPTTARQISTVPSLFVELGSDDAQWDDPAGARAVARAILDARDATPQRAFVGIGGGHYVPRFERIARETDWSPGHMLADWSLDAMAHPRRHARRFARRSSDQTHDTPSLRVTTRFCVRSSNRWATAW
ncbi:MAG: D-aminoacyl-tRNA deacylase [Halobacteriales archaeon]|nr:D-aminoacyl-tRNA deacylase [Halobacteriales archaeon]